MVLVTSAAAAAVGGKVIFEYNRENFMEDREQRMKKEFAERRFRVKQAELWREDVRDFIQLTERKMEVYLLVNVLLLGFNLNLWCEGRLPEGTPDWLMMGNQIAIGSSFTFLLLTVWLAMHASIAAQSYQTRILTQLVRLPLPTWEELEACRTHGSEFERVRPRQMLRVPFLAGRQEDIAANTAPGGVGSLQQANWQRQRSHQNPTSSTRKPSAADPWGLEQRGDDFLELGCHHGEEVAKLRHIKLVRQAAVYYQTYDAFARASMSAGVNQLMLAMSYYILGYAMTEVQAPIAAFAGVAVLVGSAEMIARIDLTLPVWDQRLIQVLLVFGPTVACLASYHYVQESDTALKIAECLATVAFISHGVVVGLMTVAYSVQEQENGAMLPLAFQGVLYLDVFGWVSHSRARDATDPEDVEATSAATVGERTRRTFDAGRLSTSLASRSLASASTRCGSEAACLGHFAREYVDSAVEASAPIDQDSSLCGGDGQHQVSSETVRAMRPASAAVAYDCEGRPTPMRPADVAPPSACDDMRFLHGAPRQWDHVNAIEPPAKEFWDPVTFMPPNDRKRRQMDSFVSGGSEAEVKADKDGASFWSARQGSDVKDDRIATGHDHEMPGVLPWQVFRNASVMISLVWIFAGMYHILQITGVWSMSLDAQQPAHEEPLDHHVNSALQKGIQEAVPRPDVFSLIAAGVSTGVVGTTPEGIDVEWPYAGFQPQTLSCSGDGARLLVSDGVHIFAAEVRGAERERRRKAHLHLGPEEPLRARFQQSPPCSATAGAAIQDAALICRDGGNDAACEALILHGDGLQLAACPLTPPAGGAASSGSAPAAASDVLTISPTWLQLPTSGSRTGRKERARWLLVDQSCSTGNGSIAQRLQQGCTAVMTTAGRVARLAGGGSSRLAPVSVSEEWRPPEGSASEFTRTLGGRYLGLLQPRRRSIRVLDVSAGVKAAGSVLLPSPSDAGAFCVGGGQVYLLESTADPRLWRFPLPDVLRAAPATAG